MVGAGGEEGMGEGQEVRWREAAEDGGEEGCEEDVGGERRDEGGEGTEEAQRWEAVEDYVKEAQGVRVEEAWARRKGKAKKCYSVSFGTNGIAIRRPMFPSQSLCTFRSLST